jgi:hypothetical protein
MGSEWRQQEWLQQELFRQELDRYRRYGATDRVAITSALAHGSHHGVTGGPICLSAAAAAYHFHQKQSV